MKIERIEQLTRGQSARLLKSIVSIMALTLCAAAQAQSITWLTKGEKIFSGNWYLPVLASDYNWNFLVVGQGSTATEADLKYQTAVYPNSEDPETVTWAGTYGSDYAKGHAPSVAMANESVGVLFLDVAIEVHQGGQEGGAALWSHVSGPLPPTVTWTNGDEYDTGYNPKVAIDPVQSFNYYDNFSRVVEVHQAGPNTSDLWYHVGTLTVDNTGGDFAFTWGPSYQFDYGYVPSVSVCGGVAVEVHEGDSGSLRYSIGTVNGDQVNWGASVQYDSGRNPSVSLCVVPGYLVEVHQGGSPATGESTSLWYHMSAYTSSAVAWEPAVQYSMGCYPTVTSTQVNFAVSDPLILETHAGACGVAAPLYYDLGSVAP